MLVVDLDALLGAIDDLAHCGDDLDDLLDELTGRMTALHATWDGLAATAQAEAQAEWEAGFRTMRDALALMRTAATRAHDNYGDAVTTNLRMWEQVR